MKNAAPVKLSIVTTLYNSSCHVEEFHRRAADAARRLHDDYEIILVNDGSPDDSLEKAIAAAHEDPHVIIVDLSRNFGHHKALMAGLGHARGDLIFLIDSDLEESPELLLTFHEQMMGEGCDVVFGVQESRRGRWSERLFGDLYYRIINTVTGLSIPHNLLTARLMTRNYVDALLLHQEREMFIAGLWQVAGFDQRPQAVRKLRTNPTSYNLRRKFSLIVNSITSFSKAPLVFIFYLGVLMAAISAAFATYLITRWLFLAAPPDGWTSLIVSIWLVGGMIISFLGVIGIYIAKIFSETKQRPNVIVKRIYGRDGA